MKKIRSNKTGVVLVTFAVLFIGLAALAALALDSTLIFRSKQSFDTFSELVSMSMLHGYHLDARVQRMWDAQVGGRGVTYKQYVLQIWGTEGYERIDHHARIMSGFVSAYNLINEQRDHVYPRYQFARMIADVDMNSLWNLIVVSQFSTDLMLAAIGPFIHDNSPHIRLGYFDEADQFVPIQKSDILFANYRRPDIEGTRAVVQMTDVDPQTESGMQRVLKILRPLFTNAKFLVTTNSVAKVSGVGVTRCMVLVLDRGISLGINTGEDDPSYTYAHWMQTGNHTIQPQQSLINTARAVPDILAQSNQFRPDNKKNSLGVVLYDVVAEALDLPDGTDPYLSHDDCAGCDTNPYKDVKDALNVTLASTALPRVPAYDFGGLGGDFDITNPACTESHAPPSDPLCQHDRLMSLEDYQKHLKNIGNPGVEDLLTLRFPPPGPNQVDGEALDPFMPFLQTDGSIGLEVAIEMIRHERYRFVEIAGFSDSEFQGEIIMMTRAEFNIFHDHNIIMNSGGAGADDSFPSVQQGGVALSCDTLGIYDSHTSGPAERYTWNPYPATWRRKVTYPVMVVDGGGDTYHDSTSRFDENHPFYTQAGNDQYLINPFPQGIVSVSNDNLNDALDSLAVCGGPGQAGCCPGPDCLGTVSSCRGNIIGGSDCNTHQVFDDMYAPILLRGVECADLAVLDYAKWAEVNNIRIHALGFRLPGDLITGETEAAERLKRLFMLYRMAVNGGLVLEDADSYCNDTSCPALEEALEQIVSYQVQLV